MEKIRRIFVLTGARSEYDLLSPVLRAANATPGLRAEVIAGAAQLSPFHGMGIEHIRRDGFPIAGTVESLLSSETWQGRALSFANLFEGVSRLIAGDRPDIMFVAGDREEALAGALAATFQGIPVAHLHGGDWRVALVAQGLALVLAHLDRARAFQHRRHGEVRERYVALRAAVVKGQ